MKKKLSFILALLMIFCMIPAAVFTVSAAAITDETKAAEKLAHLTGAGTEASPYLIDTTEDWIWFAAASYYSPLSGKTFKLTADLDFSGYYKADGKTCNLTAEQMQAYCEKWSANTVWFMIANQSITNTGTVDMMWFSGILDGNGHSISGLYWESNQNIGIVRHAAGATVKNLTLKNSTFYLTGNGDKAVGGIIGECRGITTNETSGVSAVVKANSKVDGRWQTVVSGCTVEETVTLRCEKRGKLGGIVGGTGSYNGGRILDLTVSDCTFKGNIVFDGNASNCWAGGIVALISGDCIIGRIENCTALGTITTKATSKNIFGVGGILGEANGVILSGDPHDAAGKTLATEVVGCYSDVKIVTTGTTNTSSGTSGVGALIGTVGRAKAGVTKVSDCVVVDRVSGTALSLSDFPSGSVIGGKYLGTLNMSNIAYVGEKAAVGKGSAATSKNVFTLTSTPVAASASLNLDESRVRLNAYFTLNDKVDIAEAKVNGKAVTPVADDQNRVSETVDISKVRGAGMEVLLGIEVDGIDETVFRVPYGTTVEKYRAAASEPTQALVDALYRYSDNVNAYFAGEETTDADVTVTTADPSVDATDGIAFKGATLLLDDQIRLRLWFRLDSGKNPSDFTLTVSGESVSLTEKENGWYQLTFAVPAKELNTPVIVKAGEKTVVSYSVMNYCKSAIAQETDAALAHLVKSLAAYYQSAVAAGV